MTEYIVIIYLIILGLFLKNSKIKKWYYIIICLSIFLLAAYRDANVGNDTIQYLRFFDLVNQSSLNEIIKGKYFEIGYIYINYIIKIINDSQLLFLFITSGFIYYGIFRFIYKNSKNIFLSLLLFVLLLYFFESMSAIRQYLSISILLLSFDSIKNKKNVKFLISVFLAFLFHKSAIICILLYPLYNLKIGNKTRLILFLATIFLSFVGANVLTSILFKLNFYTSYLNRLGTYKLASFIGMIINVFIYLFLVSDKNKNNVSLFFINISFVSLLLSILGLNFSILGRLSLYFEIFGIVSIANRISDIKSPKNRMAITTSVLVACFLYMFIILMYRPDWYAVVPYTSIFNK